MFGLKYIGRAIECYFDDNKDYRIKLYRVYLCKGKQSYYLKYIPEGTLNNLIMALKDSRYSAKSFSYWENLTNEELKNLFESGKQYTLKQN